jgi:hypothetical protein
VPRNTCSNRRKDSKSMISKAHVAEEQRIRKQYRLIFVFTPRNSQQTRAPTTSRSNVIDTQLSRMDVILWSPGKAR